MHLLICQVLFFYESLIKSSHDAANTLYLDNQILLCKTGSAILGIEFLARENYGTNVPKLIGFKLTIPVALGRLRLSWFYITFYTLLILTRVFKAVLFLYKYSFWGVGVLILEIVFIYYWKSRDILINLFMDTKKEREVGKRSTLFDSKC